MFNVRLQSRKSHGETPSADVGRNFSSLHLRSSRIVTLTILLLCSSPPFCPANAAALFEEKAKSFRDHVVDRVTLSDGTHLWGTAVARKPLQIFLSTKSLKRQQPRLFSTEILPELRKLRHVDSQELAESLQSEINRQNAKTPEDQRRIVLLKETLVRLMPEEVEEPEMLILELPKKRTRNVELQTDARRDLGRLAVLNGLQEIEDAHWKSIAAQLHAIPERDRVRNVPARANKQDHEQNLSRILAAVDLRLNAAARLIQNGASIVDESAEFEPAVVINSLLGGNVQTLLAELLNEGAAAPGLLVRKDQLPEAAGKIADAKNQATVLISGFEFELANQSATVTRRLFRKTQEGEWELLLTSVGQSTSADVRPDQVTALENDPQVKSIAELTQSLGIGNGQLSSALRMGAVVQNALHEAEQKFENDIQAILTARNLREARLPAFIQLPDEPL